MKALISLRWKILAWFFVNLVVLGAVLMLFLRAQFRVGIGSLLAGPANARLEALALPLLTELRGLPAEQWGARARACHRRPAQARRTRRALGDLAQ